MTQRAAGVALVIGVSVSTATLAEAACTPNAVDATTPAPGTTVTCDLTTTEQNAPHGYGTGNQTGITIDVLDNASVQGSALGASNGIWVGDAKIRNGVGASIIGQTNGITAATGPLTLTNNGTITGTNGTGVSANGNITLTNNAGGVISGANGVVSTNGGITLDNSGSITGTSGAGIDVLNGGTVINRTGGVIFGGTIGIFGRGGSLTLDNSGTITSGGAGTVAASSQGNVTLINRAGATINGNVVAGADMVAENSGYLGGVSGATGTVLNTATGVIGLVGGVLNTNNFGIINSVFAGGTLVNHAGASISGLGFAPAVTAANLSITNSGTISGSTGIAVANGGLQLVNNVGASISGAGFAIYGDVSSTGASIFNAGTISGGTNPLFFGGAMLFMGGGNTLTLAPTSVISGQVLAPFGSNTLQLGGSGTGSFDISQLGLDPALQYVGFTTFNKIDSSLWSLTGTSPYNGSVNVNGGTLIVNGNLAAASLLTVNAGGILGGNGVLGATVINGGTLAPGNSIGTLTMSSLSMTAASTYLVQVSGISSDKTLVTGSASIAGKVSVDPLARLNSTTTFTILKAGTLSGTFDSASVINNFARNARLSYDGDYVLLTLDPGLLSPNLTGTASINQRRVAAGIDNALEGGANLSTSFNGLFALNGDNLLNALTQISGEASTGAQQTTFDAMTQFMGVMTDPYTAGRSGSAPGALAFAAGNDPLAYAPDGRKRTRTERDAFAMFAKAPPRAYEARWNVWAAGFGGSRTTDGNAALGSNRVTGKIAGVAVGADYWLSPSSVAGFALAGGGTGFSVSNGGSGRSDLFQAGAFVRHGIGSSYITATAAYGWQDISTDRLITAVDTERLRASFNANAFSGRIEGGNRWLVPELGGIGLTPYAAVQVTAFHLPAYAETSLNGAGGFALNYSANTATAPRTELGLRGDKSWALAEGLLTLRGRAAWAHDYNTDRNVSAVFQSLPGSTFTVNGARAARNVALTSVSAELSFNSGWSASATFEGEFSDVSRSYAGKGVLRYTW
ncbi:autotransporter domain-containing protein [Bosea sp. 685]|uniref:autotransporter outer membrane beta-barrel domain-containing protein n=1 Tax=Bosea sp. 685 TaxID=3080057 RepID=UPI002892FCDE|nr:autotransporter domain-containing protein [Bosea sp. 685]WNJ88345.1 autotransporter domain-containing protein [Bosea sp. 685]